ncbi:MAG: periplasmic heavy metal sensor [Zhongshania sp.]|uniref:periplasmic heavy metal sensor n=1 Tax=Zhongshania sp. TaxID=1971902 RepID=UPI002634EAE8|nr:periplasmic heavy metal sensor [Zhongshania sp.]MDF1691942.1 periplasmic heavy metal sensor [Zhongshania sp.]
MTSRKGILIALLASVIINGALIGLIVGHRMEGEERRAMHGMTRQLLRDEPSEFAEPMRLAMEAHRSEMRSAFRQMRSARRDMFKILKIPEASTADINQGFVRIREAEMNLKAISHQVLAEVLPNMPVEQRLHFAKEDMMRRHGGKPHSGERPAN